MSDYAVDFERIYYHVPIPQDSIQQINSTGYLVTQRENISADCTHRLNE